MTIFKYGLAMVLLLCGSSSLYAAEQWALCRPAEVVAYQNRVHVRCEVPVAPNIVFLATPTQPDFRFATRVVALGAAAQTSEKTLVILFDPADTTGPAFGCQAGDCRPLKAIGLTEAAPPRPTTPTTPTNPKNPTERQRCLRACNAAAVICTRKNRDDPALCAEEKAACQAECP